MKLEGRIGNRVCDVFRLLRMMFCCIVGIGWVCVFAHKGVGYSCYVGSGFTVVGVLLCCRWDLHFYLYGRQAYGYNGGAILGGDGVFLHFKGCL